MVFKHYFIVENFHDALGAYVDVDEGLSVQFDIIQNLFCDRLWPRMVHLNWPMTPSKCCIIRLIVDHFSSLALRIEDHPVANGQKFELFFKCCLEKDLVSLGTIYENLRYDGRVGFTLDVNGQLCPILREKVMNDVIVILFLKNATIKIYFGVVFFI